MTNSNTAKETAQNILDKAIEKGFDFEGSAGAMTRLIEGIIEERINSNTLDSISATDEMEDKGLCSTGKEINILRRAIKNSKLTTLQYSFENGLTKIQAVPNTNSWKNLKPIK
jgi:hypothetical protein